MSDKKLFVTQPFLPPLEDFIPYLEKIWASKVLTNGGAMHQQLEVALAEYLGVEHVALFNNGTIALLVALKALNIRGEVITTPYSFVATAHSLLWNDLKPIFVDIDPVTLNMDPNKIRNAITEHTTAIMPVHCYGNPCATEQIGEIAREYGLKVIYDAAHAFGVEDGGGSILRHGDLSVLSFHATKVFNTFEGGAIICPTAEMKKRIDQLKNFGFVDELTVVEVGINGKMSEINAAFGLLQLKNVDKAIARRAEIYSKYVAKFSSVAGLRVVDFSSVHRANYSYFPLMIENSFSVSRDALYEKLKQLEIYARRYFYPLISNFPMYASLSSSKVENLLVANEAASQVLCLPIYPDMSDLDQDRICRAILEFS